MGTRPQSDGDLFRILLYRNDATELLLAMTPDGLGLPAIRVPAYTRAAEEITVAIKISWNLETYCLFSLPSRAAVHYQVVELFQSNTSGPAEMQWLPVLSLSAGAFALATDFAAIQKPFIHPPEMGGLNFQIKFVDQSGHQRQLLGGTNRAADAHRIIGG